MRRSCLCLAIILSAATAGLSQPGQPGWDVPFVPEGKPLAGLVITIDAGHGGSAHQEGYHGSARGVESRVVEGDLNMLATAELFHSLQWAGAKVIMTRRDDRKVTYGASDRAEELGARPAMADASKSHLFVSLHHNSTGRKTADGVVVMIWPTDSKGKDQPLERAFADLLREEAQKEVRHKEDFKPYINNHPLVADSDIPSVVVEFGFLSNPEFDAWVSQRGSHIAEARGVYNGVMRMWQIHGEALKQLRAELFPETAEEAKAPPVAPEIIPSVDKRFARLAQRLHHGDKPPATPEHAEHILDLYRKVTLSDSTFFYLNTSVTREGETWVLKGETNNAIVGTAAGKVLEAAGCKPLRNEIGALPSPALGEKKFGVVQIPMAFTWAKPAEGDGVQTQLLLGEPVWLLDVSEDGRYLLLQGGEGYAGWVRREAVLELDAKEFKFWNESPRATVRKDFFANDFRIPAGAALPIVEGAEKGTGTMTLRLPKAVRGSGGKQDIQAPAEMLVLPSTPSAGDRVAEAAKEFLTTPYVFGGRSRTGVDCSGLVGVAWASVGLTVPRDAFQQVIVGRMVATPWHREGLRAGDMVFFIDETGRMIHTGLSLGGDLFIHASPPHVHVSSFDSQDPLYSENFAPLLCFARRPMP